MIELRQKVLVEEYHQTRSAVPDMTMTTDTSFVERPAATKPSRTPSQRGDQPEVVDLGDDYYAQQEIVYMYVCKRIPLKYVPSS